MNTTRNAGFTIIEVVLFLAITGLMAAVMLGGWTTMINTQRYGDSVKTLQAFMQQQYNLVYNVQNERNNAYTCDSADGVKTNGSAVARGQTDCVLLGRYITLYNGTDMSVRSVIGIEPTGDTSTTNDIDALLAFDPKYSVENSGLADSEFVIPWGAVAIDSPSNKNAQNYAIAILRSPESGIVHTYAQKLTGSGQAPAVASFVTVANESEDIVWCLDAGAPLVSSNMGVVIAKGASSQNFVYARTAEDDICR